MPKVKVPLKEIAKLTKRLLEKNNIPYDEIKVSEGEKEDEVDYIIAVYTKKVLPFNKMMEIRRKLYDDLKEILEGGRFVVAYLPM
ncbi:hypothetical protein GWK41_06850 [Persephonella atlantica]|uniref:Uncharacterized protein n=1 Tax=Persephonella atlantica TaxID=2699429 RepID=A0ABS1GIP1_9AQUI|nr:hypothetical protein [Persephonella atlantica]MBK3332784.1 hypothetical protein [Persephonella atlantica]